MKYLMKTMIGLTCALVIGVVSGCAGAKPADITGGITDAVKATTVICESAQLLSDAGIDVPGVDQCEDILPQLTSNEAVVIWAVLNCVTEHGVGSKECAQCAVDVGWDPVKDRIVELSGK